MRLEQIGDGTWIAYQPRHAVRWFGLPFACSGLAVLAGAFGAFEIRGEDGGQASLWVVVPFGAIFASLGFGLLFAQRGFELDLKRQQLTRWLRIGFPVYRKTRSTAKSTEVVHSKRVIRSDKGSRTIYPVELAQGDGQALLATNCASYLDARRAAEELAKLLQLPVVDRTSGDERRREVTDLDRSLRDQRDAGLAISVGDAPAAMRSLMRPRGDAIEFHVPAFGITIYHVLGLALATGPLWMSLLFVLVAGGAELGAAATAIVIGMGALPLLAMSGLILYHAHRRYVVVASKDELRVTESGLRRRVSVIPSDELEELRVSSTKSSSLAAWIGGGPPIEAISDRMRVRFGDTLKVEESRYISEAIRALLSSPR